jgi:hypothetical protein
MKDIIVGHGQSYGRAGLRRIKIRSLFLKRDGFFKKKGKQCFTGFSCKIAMFEFGIKCGTTYFLSRTVDIFSLGGNLETALQMDQPHLLCCTPEFCGRVRPAAFKRDAPALDNQGDDA